MARTRQTTRKKTTVVTQATRKQAVPKAKKKEEKKQEKVVAPLPQRFTQTNTFADCAVCLTSLRKYGVGNTNGHTCPPCTNAIKQADAQRRREFVVRQGVFVPQNEDEPVVAVWMDTFNVSEKIALVTCDMYHSSYSLKDTAPIYTCYMDDFALWKYPNNRRAYIVAGMMGVFHLAEGASYCGPCLFLGPNGTSLLPEEIKKFTNVV